MEKVKDFERKILSPKDNEENGWVKWESGFVELSYKTDL